MKKLLTILSSIFLIYGCSQTPQENISSIKIGDQIWSSINLDINTFRNGDLIPQSENRQEWMKAADLEDAVWCYYKFDSKYSYLGRFYNYYAVCDERELAPNGWRIPTFYDSWVLVNSIDPLFTIEKFGGSESSLAGGSLKSKNNELEKYWDGNTCPQIDCGFKAIAAGGFTPSKDYPKYDWEPIKKEARFWVLTNWAEIIELPGLLDVKTKDNLKQKLSAGGFNEKSIVMRLRSFNCEVDWDDDPKSYGYSVRLIKEK